MEEEEDDDDDLDDSSHRRQPKNSSSTTQQHKVVVFPSRKILVQIVDVQKNSTWRAPFATIRRRGRKASPRTRDCCCTRCTNKRRKDRRRTRTRRRSGRDCTIQRNCSDLKRGSFWKKCRQSSPWNDTATRWKCLTRTGIS